MKVKLHFSQTWDNYRQYYETRLTHIGAMDDNGKHVTFLKHDPELIKRLQGIVIDLPKPPNHD